jgi:hypothetical protein
MNQPVYLTPELIAEVLRQANDFVWRIGVLAKLTKNWYDVMTISPKGLIFIEGNSDTGWKHITERHGYFSNRSYFGDGSIGNPNKFTRTSVPIDDYRMVADDVFTPNNKDNKIHPDSHLFEKFKGKSSHYTGSNGIEQEFHLVLYKGTKIVHSLYPSKNLEGKIPKRILRDFIRSKDKITATTRPKDDYYIVKIPYENKQGIVRYIIIFKIDSSSLMTKGYIQVNNFDGADWFTTYPHLCYFKVNTVLPSTFFGNIPIEFTRFINTLCFTNLSKLEVVIADIEAQLLEIIQRNK